MPSAGCDAKIRPLQTPIELECVSPEDVPHVEHFAELRDFAYPGSLTTIHFLESDRRCYHGAYPGDCPTPGCTLPAHHPRDCYVE